MTWQKFVEVLKNYMNYLRLPTPKVGSIGDFEYLVWNNHVVGFSKSTGLLNLDGVTEKIDEIPLDRILMAFGIPVTSNGQDIYLVEMLVWDISRTDDVVEIAFNGENKLKIIEEKSRLKIISTGFVGWNEKFFDIGQELWGESLKPGFEIQQVNVADGLIKVIVGKSIVVTQEIQVLNMDEWPKASSDKMLLLYGNGDGRIVIRPFSPDFDGSDWYTFSQVKKLASQLCKEFGLKLEVCPLICLPTNQPAILVLVQEKEVLENILKRLKELLEE